jgi:hypothetical protein
VIVVDVNVIVYLLPDRVLSMTDFTTTLRDEDAEE